MTNINKKGNTPTKTDVNEVCPQRANAIKEIITIRKKMENMFPTYTATTSGMAECYRGDEPSDIKILDNKVSSLTDNQTEEHRHGWYADIITRKKRVHWDLYVPDIPIQYAENKSLIPAALVIYDDTTEEYDPNGNYELFALGDLSTAKKLVDTLKSTKSGEFEKKDIPECIQKTLRSMREPNYFIVEDKDIKIIIDHSSEAKITPKFLLEKVIVHESKATTINFDTCREDKDNKKECTIKDFLENNTLSKGCDIFRNDNEVSFKHVYIEEYDTDLCEDNLMYFTHTTNVSIECLSKESAKLLSAILSKKN